MDITRDLFPTDNRVPYFSLTLASRDLAAHSVLSGLTPAEHDQIADTLTAAATALKVVLAGAWARHRASESSGSFGCGT